MTDRIKLLPDSVANQIAAGEVVNRPSSVVKEMLENAVDAGSKNITVNFRDGGKALIQIVDDGCGMTPADARLAFDRHATSKIDGVEDIYQLHTFGFRGEALASIASVAEVELRTRTHKNELGTRIEINGGKFSGQDNVACPSGSQFIVKNLFYNVPARRRFLEKSSTESRHIIAEFQRVALCHPEVAFTLLENDNPVSKLPAASLRQRIIGITGNKAAKNLLEVNVDTSIVKVEGFTGNPASARQTNREQFLFVNGRYFKSPYFHKAVVSAYEKLIPQNTQPSYFIYLTIDPQRIDVNVHPQKTEVKFEDGTEIWQIINAAVRESLAKSGAVPSMDFEMDPDTEIPVFCRNMEIKVPGISANPDFNPFRETRSDYQPSEQVPQMASEDRFSYHTGASDLECDRERFDESILEYIEAGEDTQASIDMGRGACIPAVFQAGTKYAVTPGEDGITVIDIRRAYESVMYEKYLTMLGNGTSASQQLLFPERVVMSLDDFNLLGRHMDDFASFGFDLNTVGDLTVEVRGIPADMTSQQPETMLYDLLDALRDEEKLTGEMRKRRLAEVMAKIASAMKPRKMTKEELSALLASLAECTNNSYTPSGLPVAAVISEDEIASKLKKNY